MTQAIENTIAQAYQISNDVAKLVAEAKARASAQRGGL